MARVTLIASRLCTGDKTRLAGFSGALGAATGRGFVGVAFRLQGEDPPDYEAFYLRPTNGRADDQVRRNHSAQYISHPDFPWFKLRQDTPGGYESYVDLVPDVWTHVKIVVSGLRAELYVNDAKQPCLIVKDLKLGEVAGPVALWINAGTDAHFADRAAGSSTHGYVPVSKSHAHQTGQGLVGEERAFQGLRPIGGLGDDDHVGPDGHDPFDADAGGTLDACSGRAVDSPGELNDVPHRGTLPAGVYGGS
ncbi:MAG: hypothetical protein IIA00_08940 [Proteobacteria bacterium]|nr:hypothetical protein [Pseudomonadota bacterium]